MAHYVDSEVGQLRTVLLHRPGPELARLTPRNNDSLLFDGIPWVGRAQEEHDIFAGALRDRGVTVLYLAIAAIALQRLRTRSRDAKPPFEATLREFAADREILKGDHEQPT